MSTCTYVVSTLMQHLRMSCQHVRMPCPHVCTLCPCMLLYAHRINMHVYMHIVSTCTYVVSTCICMHIVCMLCLHVHVSGQIRECTMSLCYIQLFNLICIVCILDAVEIVFSLFILSLVAILTAIYYFWSKKSDSEQKRRECEQDTEESWTIQNAGIMKGTKVLTLSTSNLETHCLN